MSLIDLVNKKSILPSSSEALPGRVEEIEVPSKHFVTNFETSSTKLSGHSTTENRSKIFPTQT